MDVFQKRGFEAYCNMFDADLPNRSKDFKPQDYVFDAFKTLSNADVVFVVLKSSEKSEGMILEVGYAIAKGISVVVAVQDEVKNTYLPGMATKMFTWSTVEDLIEKTKNFDLK